MIKNNYKKKRVRRSCGGCVACCTAIKVESVNKQAQQDCEFSLAGNGCSIYKRRPWECKRWNCYWRVGADGFDGEDHRPDKLGIVAHEGSLNNGRGIFFYEVIPGALSSSKVIKLINKWNTLLTIVTIPINPLRSENGNPLGDLFLPRTFSVPMIGISVVGEI